MYALHSAMYHKIYTVKDTPSEKVSSNKTPMFSKSMNMDIWMVDNTLTFLNWSKILEKIKSLWQINFVISISFVVKLAFDRAVLYRNALFSILVLSTKSGRFCVFQKVFQKLKYWKLSKFPVIVTWKHADLINGGLF